MNFKPLNDLVLIQPDAPKEKIGSIFIPKQAQECVYHGTVRAVGKGRYVGNTHKPLDVKRGDRVVFNPTEGFEVKLDGKDYRVLKEEHIDYVIS
jgi:chaperonin GroES